MISVVFFLLLIGLLIGKIKLFGIRLGLAGVLVVSLLSGWLIKNYTVIYDTSFAEICSFLSTFGTMLFLSVIGLQAGEAFVTSNFKKQWKAFLGGICVVIIGALMLLGCLWIERGSAKDLILGIFAGSMTSTPTMSAALEVYGVHSSVAVGYGISYCIGLLSVVLFVQMVRLPCIDNTKKQGDDKSSTSNRLSSLDSLVVLSGIVLLGLLVSTILPIGKTGGVLISGILVGAITAKKGIRCADLPSYKTIGLLLFFIGSGVCAGAQLSAGISWYYALYGTVISVVAIGLGYCLIHFVLGFSRAETLAIICGGMTSTPAIGALQQRDCEVDLSLYATSYMGALIVLLTFIQIMLSI